ncbi:MAG: flagellar motor switch protein FliN [Desulfobacterales bacterium]|jgi:flagellar motor switch protein FliN/FliY|nr:flagellar motor switch protein FliN [Desulfobacterales bacterium]
MTTATETPPGATTEAGRKAAGPAPGSASPAPAAASMEFILDVPLEVTVELGRTKLLVHELLKLGQGSVVELSKLAGEALEIFANQKLIARGEAVVSNDKYGVRLTEVVSPTERIERLR